MRAWLPAAILVTSCGSSQPATIVVSGANFSSEEGKPVKISVVDVGAKRVIAQSIQTVVTAGKINVTIEVPPDVQYRVDAFIDDDGDGHCQWGDTLDHVYSVDVKPIAGGKTFPAVLVLDQTDPAGCLSYGNGSLRIRATNLNSGSAAYFIAALIRHDDGLVLGERTAAVTNNGIDYTFPGAVFPGKQYDVDFYVEKDGRLGCTSGDLGYSGSPTRFLGGVPTDGLRVDDVPIDLMVDGNTATQDPGVCATFQ